MGYDYSLYQVALDSIPPQSLNFKPLKININFTDKTVYADELAILGTILEDLESSFYISFLSWVADQNEDIFNIDLDDLTFKEAQEIISLRDAVSKLLATSFREVTREFPFIAELKQVKKGSFFTEFILPPEAINLMIGLIAITLGENIKRAWLKTSMSYKFENFLFNKSFDAEEIQKRTKSRFIEKTRKIGTSKKVMFKIEENGENIVTINIEKKLTTNQIKALEKFIERQKNQDFGGGNEQEF